MMNKHQELMAASVHIVSQRDTSWINAFSLRLEALFHAGWIDGKDYDFIAACTTIAEDVVTKFMAHSKKKGGA